VIWATRTGPHVDRAACAWLIGRSVDPEATFVFVDDVTSALAFPQVTELRRRRFQRTNTGEPGPAFWVDSRSWGRGA